MGQTTSSDQSAAGRLNMENLRKRHPTIPKEVERVLRAGCPLVKRSAVKPVSKPAAKQRGEHMKGGSSSDVTPVASPLCIGGTPTSVGSPTPSSVHSGSCSGVGHYTDMEPVWVEDDLRQACYNCKTRFSVSRRRHHCRCCGEIFCDGIVKTSRGRNTKFGHSARVGRFGTSSSSSSSRGSTSLSGAVNETVETPCWGRQVVFAGHECGPAVTVDSRQIIDSVEEWGASEPQVEKICSVCYDVLSGSMRHFLGDGMDVRISRISAQVEKLAQAQRCNVPEPLEVEISQKRFAYQAACERAQEEALEEHRRRAVASHQQSTPPLPVISATQQVAPTEQHKPEVAAGESSSSSASTTPLSPPLDYAGPRSLESSATTINESPHGGHSDLGEPDGGTQKERLSPVVADEDAGGAAHLQLPDAVGRSNDTTTTKVSNPASDEADDSLATERDPPSTTTRNTTVGCTVDESCDENKTASAEGKDSVNIGGTSPPTPELKTAARDWLRSLQSEAAAATGKQHAAQVHEHPNSQLKSTLTAAKKTQQNQKDEMSVVNDEMLPVKDGHFRLQVLDWRPFNRRTRIAFSSRATGEEEPRCDHHHHDGTGAAAHTAGHQYIPKSASLGRVCSGHDLASGGQSVGNHSFSGGAALPQSSSTISLTGTTNNTSFVKSLGNVSFATSSTVAGLSSLRKLRGKSRYDFSIMDCHVISDEEEEEEEEEEDVGQGELPTTEELSSNRPTTHPPPSRRRALLLPSRFEFVCSNLKAADLQVVDDVAAARMEVALSTGQECLYMTPDDSTFVPLSAAACRSLQSQGSCRTSSMMSANSGDMPLTDAPPAIVAAAAAAGTLAVTPPSGLSELPCSASAQPYQRQGSKLLSPRSQNTKGGSDDFSKLQGGLACCIDSGKARGRARVQVGMSTSTSLRNFLGTDKDHYPLNR